MSQHSSSTMSHTSTESLDESLIQQVQRWMEEKNTADLVNIFRDTEDKPDAYSGEVIEAVHRILAKRMPLEHDSEGRKLEKAEKFSIWTCGLDLLGKFEVLYPNGERHDIHAYRTLRKKILEGTINRMHSIRQLPDIGKDPHKDMETTAIEWNTVELVAKQDPTLGLIYWPIQTHSKLGLQVGTNLAYITYYLYFWFLTRDVYSPPSSLADDMVFLLLCLGIGMYYIPQKRIYDFLSALILLIFLFPVEFWGHDVSLSNKLWLDALWVTWRVLGSLFFGLIVGGPTGAILGTMVGHFRAKTLPRAPDAEPEDTRPYLIGLVYAPLALLVALPLTWWLYPLFFASLIHS